MWQKVSGLEVKQAIKKALKFKLLNTPHKAKQGGERIIGPFLQKGMSAQIYVCLEAVLPMFCENNKVAIVLSFIFRPSFSHPFVMKMFMLIIINSKVHLHTR